MSADQDKLSLATAAPEPERWALASVVPARHFRFGLLLAVIVHAALVIGISRASPGGEGHVGADRGETDPLAVSLVSDSEYMDAIGEPKATQAAPETPAKPPENTAEPAAPPAAPELTAAPEPAVVAAPPPVQKPAPDLLALPVPAAKPAAKPEIAKPQQQRSAGLDLSIPAGVLQRQASAAGRATATNRPPDITRSVENDEFGRAVNAAMRRTMPTADGTVARVTIRIILSETGNVVEAQLVSAGKDPILEQNVLFSARQASYPIPPRGSTPADRTFRVNYIYN